MPVSLLARRQGVQVECGRAQDEEVSAGGGELCGQGRSLSKFVSRGITKSRGGTWQTYVAMGAPKRLAALDRKTEAEHALRLLVPPHRADADGDGDIPSSCLQVPAPCCSLHGSEAQPPAQPVACPTARAWAVRVKVGGASGGSEPASRRLPGRPPHPDYPTIPHIEDDLFSGSYAQKKQAKKSNV
ncbi:Protein of unknown function [Gryllus bimaculatus]|nr:Protein of unknown function [Gryllus bimaculatus]